MPSGPTSQTTSWLILAVSVLVSLAFSYDLCNAIYSCGCKSWWAGGADHCNIHNPQPPHCPFCKYGLTTFPAMLAAVVGTQYLFSFRMRRWPWPARLVSSLLAFPVVGGVIGWAVGWWVGYWN